VSTNHDAAGQPIATDTQDIWELRIITPPGILPAAARALRAHHCRVEEYETCCEIFFPAGTTRKEVFPRTPMSERYDVTLPDGYSILEMYMLHRRQSLLYYPSEHLEKR